MTYRLSMTSLIGLAVVLLASPVRAEDPTLAGLELGKYAAGPEISVRDLRGRVVVIEYWGITCAPCIAGIPHTTELAEEYGHEKLVIVANQVWSATDRQCKEVWEQHAKSDYVAVFNGGKVQNFNPTGVPTAVIFDHEGKFLWQGHPGGMDSVIAEAVARVPDRAASAEAEQEQGPEPIVTGIDAEHFSREIEQINAQDRPISSTLSRLRRAAERASQQDVVDEANAVLAAVQAWAEDSTGRANTLLSDDPAEAYAIVQRVADLLGRDELGKPLAELKSRIESDPAVMDVVRATNMLRETLERARSIGLADDHAAAADRSNARAIREITRDLRRIQSNWPETDAGKQAGELLSAWGLDAD